MQSQAATDARLSATTNANLRGTTHKSMDDTLSLKGPRLFSQVSDHMNHTTVGGESSALLTGIEITKERLNDSIRLMTVPRKRKDEDIEQPIILQGIEPKITIPEQPPKSRANHEQIDMLQKEQNAERSRNPNDFFESLRNYPELILEIAQHLRIRDFISLFAISRCFHLTIKSCFFYFIRRYSNYNAAESTEIFRFTFYDDLCIPDPDGLPHPTKSGQVRKIPGLPWLQMVVHREKTIRDILACMARQGHRMPQGMSISLKKMWLLMDISTSARRAQLMHSDYFTNMDIYNIELFLVKLDMRFNDPVHGPGDESLRELMLGQRGLTPLCKLLKRTAFKDSMEIMKLSIRYEFNIWPEHVGMAMFDIPAHEIGAGHLEGWGAGKVHLMRPDELVVYESVRRGLNLKEHLMMMVLWGYIDPITCKNVDVSDEEMYMSETE